MRSIAQLVWLAVALYGFAAAADTPDYLVLADTPDYQTAFTAKPELAICQGGVLDCQCGCLEGGLCLCGIGPVEAAAPKRYSHVGGKWVVSPNGTHTGQPVGNGRWRYTPIAKQRAPRAVYPMLRMRGGNCPGGICR